MYKVFLIVAVALLASDITGVKSKQQNRKTEKTPSRAELEKCIRNCPTTLEYKPVCGSNDVTYSNPAKLLCAQGCGENVYMVKPSPC